MNNSKKTIKNTQQKKKNNMFSNPKLWLITSIVLVVILITAVLFDQLYKRVIITIDDDKYYMEDLTYYFYGVESQYAYYDQLFGGSYWDMSFGDTTVREQAKQEAISTSIYNEIMYREAVANNYTLTAEETDANAENIKTLLTEQLSKDLAKHNGFTEKYLTKVIGKTTLVSRYYQDLIDAFDIDDEGIKAGIDFDEYKQYDIETLFISTNNTDEEGTATAMNEEDKNSAFLKINALYTNALTTEDWSSLIPEDEEELTYQEDSFIESDTTFSEDFKAVIMAMKNNQISEVYEAEDGYYIVRMINNASTERFESEVDKAISEEENAAFDVLYQEILKKYEYQINNKALDKLTMGQITLIN